MNIPFESKLSDIKDLNKRNEIFKSLPVKERVKEIGYDILLNYMTGKMKKQTGTQYWPVPVVEHLKNEGDPVLFQKEVEEMKDDILCSVCARGAIMVSRILLGDSIAGDGSSNFCHGEEDYNCESIIEEFDYSELCDMENAYENYGYVRYEARTPECIAALAANLVANGHFNENDETDYLKEWDIKILDETSIMDEIEGIHSDSF